MDNLAGLILPGGPQWTTNISSINLLYESNQDLNPNIYPNYCAGAAEPTLLCTYNNLCSSNKDLKQITFDPMSLLWGGGPSTIHSPFLV